MISIDLLSMDEYKPVHGQKVDLYLADKSHVPLVGIYLTTATCEIHYQGFEASDRQQIPSWTSNTPKEMEKIPFNTPFVHVTEPFPDDPEMNKIIGFRLLEEDELKVMGEVADLRYLFRCALQGMSKDHEDYPEIIREREEALKPYKGVEPTYWQKRWFFNLGNGHQISDDDNGNEVLGIMANHRLGEILEPRVLKTFEAKK